MTHSSPLRGAYKRVFTQVPDNLQVRRAPKHVLVRRWPKTALLRGDGFPQDQILQLVPGLSKSCCGWTTSYTAKTPYNDDSPCKYEQAMVSHGSKMVKVSSQIPWPKSHRRLRSVDTNVLSRQCSLVGICMFDSGLVVGTLFQFWVC